MQLLQFFVKTSFRSLALEIAFFRSLPKIHDHVRIRKKTVLKIKSFACFDSSHFMTTEKTKVRSTALALPIRVSSFSSPFLSLVNAPPQHLNFLTYFSVAPFAKRADQGFFKNEVG